MELRDWRPKESVPSLPVCFQLVKLETALEWGVSPDEFMRKDKKIQAMMIATVEIKRLKEAWYTEQIQQRVNQRSSPQGKRQ
jgi:hypothetical protein